VSATVFSGSGEGKYEDVSIPIELSINQDVHKGSRCLAGLAVCHPALAVFHPALAVCHPGLDPGSSGTPILDCGSWPAMTTLARNDNACPQWQRLARNGNTASVLVGGVMNFGNINSMWIRT
jgi:hypothetical protein